MSWFGNHFPPGFDHYKDLDNGHHGCGIPAWGIVVIVASSLFMLLLMICLLGAAFPNLFKCCKPAPPPRTEAAAANAAPEDGLRYDA
ncbi:hypothetical protein MtrunA17_Chr5g0442051 [Medicago truncatula]|nr:hypothetical protein MtrunA17_Chr5g0442051 [Medicago truncatula]